MSNIGFRKRKDAEAALRVARQYDGRAFATEVHGQGWILQAPVAGIPGRVGTTLGKAQCKVFYIDDNDELQEFLRPDGSSYEIDCWNFCFEQIAGNAYIQAKDIGGKPVADVECCDQP